MIVSGSAGAAGTNSLPFTDNPSTSAEMAGCVWRRARITRAPPSFYNSATESVAGWYSGAAKDSQETLEFSTLTGMHPMIEKYPLNRVADAYEQMHSGKVRFRVVLTLGR